MVQAEAPRKVRTALTGQTLKIYWQYARPYWLLLLCTAAGMSMSIGADIVGPLVYKRFFDTLALDPLGETEGANLSGIYRMIGAITLVLGISWTGWRFSNMGLMRLESQVMKNLTDQCFSYLQDHSHRFFTDNFGGALVKRVHRFARGFETITDQCVMGLGQTMVKIILIVGVLFSQNTILGWVFLGWTIAFVTYNLVFARWKLQYDLVRAELDTRVTARLADGIANNVNMKLFAGVDREVTQFKRLTEDHRAALYRSWRLGWWSDTMQGGSTRVLEIVMLIMAVRYWLAGALTIGSFVLLRSYLSRLTEDVREIGQNVRMIYEAIADANEMTEILVTPHEVLDVEGAAILDVVEGQVGFRNVQFSYGRGGRVVLRDFSLSIKQGEKVAIVGPSGGGKSTILKLLIRLYDIQGGTILIDHQDITRVTQVSLHRQIAYVPQDPILFHRPLMENIRYARPEATDAEVIEAAKLAHCHEFISRFPLGYETLVGERGIKLSGGERQRVAIARAILMQAPILVLDEATSSLDSESEAYIQDSLRRLIQGRTVIAIAHRLSTIHKMDRIVVVEDGHITEEGNHALLLQIDKGMYRHLWNLQSVVSSDEEVPRDASIQ
ncbi:MAG: ABC transporter ATP-binding protein [Patescibacteria group bacterium]